MSLYNHFATKDGLVEAYLRRRAGTLTAVMARAAGGTADPRGKVLAVFDALRGAMCARGFCGCPFQRAYAESGAAKATRGAVLEFKAGTRRLLTELARGAGARDPESLGMQLTILVEGALFCSALEDPATTGRRASAAAEVLLDAGAMRDGMPHATRGP
jgi:AcrR family transcriptional regulator